MGYFLLFETSLYKTPNSLATRSKDVLVLHTELSFFLENTASFYELNLWAQDLLFSKSNLINLYIFPLGLFYSWKLRVLF